MTEYLYAVADVFTDVPLQGNPVAVFLDASGLETEQMQRAARELNLSETVFVLPGEDPTPIRIFTPTAELPFAGHPVLGAAFLLGEAAGAELVALEPPIGRVPVALRRRDGKIEYGEMEQPIPRRVDSDLSERLLSGLGIDRAVGAAAVYTNGPTFAYVELESQPQLRGLRPDLNAVADLGALGVSCFAGTVPSLEVRMFAPGLGVAEDPATGSAAGPLAVHLALAGRLRFGQELEIHQGLQVGRPSLIRARVEGSGQRIERVVVGGAAVVVARGTYRLS